jgi:UDP-glucuronate decarboxylase
MKRILVTGGAGFLGANLCERLVKDKNNYVIALDNLFTGRIENIRECMRHDNFKFIKADVQDKIDIRVDQIYNAACPASPPAYQASPTNTTKTCVYGIINMLELAKKYDATILQFSTSEVYGDPEVHPQVESYRGCVNPNGIRSCYDEGKRVAESLCFDYNREFGTKIKIIRIFNTYGRYMDPKDGRVISNFIMQALRGEDITVYGDGRQTRSFQYVDDLIEGIIRMMNYSRPDFLGPVNLGNPEEHTMLDLAKMVIKHTGSNSSIVFEPCPSDDPRRRQACIDVAKKELNGWTPRISLDEGLEKSIEYFKQFVGVDECGENSVKSRAVKSA